MIFLAKTLRHFALTCLAALLCCGAYLGYLRLSGNFHEVIPGELYRSAQPSAADITDYAKRYGIKTIVNLRGPSPSPWYQQELGVSQQLGIEHVDFRMSAGRDLTIDKAERLIALLKSAPKPILIHCEGGADRSGLASVLYLQQVAGVNEEQAEQQLWPVLYGHVGIPYVTRAYAMDRSWLVFEKAFGIES
ncbi:dual specificity protein phosphatase family protein [Allorhizobium taibaishanense]